MERCSVYLARLVRILNDLAERGIARETGLRRENGGTLYEEGYVKALLGNGWEACGYAAGRVENTLRLATQDGLLIANDYDDWRAGMASGSGVRTYYGLTFKGKKQAEIASTMWLFCDEASEETGQGCGPERVAAERTESPKREPAGGKGEMPPFTADKLTEMTAEELQAAGLGLFLLLAQTYYKLLESAFSMATWYTELDLDLNGAYLWTLKHIRILLDNHEVFKDFPMKFEPPYPDLFPASVGNVQWQDMVAPDAERFLSTVQEYVIEKGFRAPEEGSHAWSFIESYRPEVNLAIEKGNAYHKRIMDEYRRTNLKVQSGARANDAEGAKTDARAAGRPEAPQADEKSKTPAIMSVEEALRLCRAKPNEAFLYWKSMENGRTTAGAVQGENEGVSARVSQFLANWFEICGHWRDLKLDASTGARGGAMRPDGRQRISEFVRSRRAKVQYFDYDEVQADHVPIDSDKKYAKYTWTYLLAGEPQVILRVDDPDAQRSAVEEQYLSKAKPTGFSYWIEDKEHGVREVCLHFQSGTTVGFFWGYSGSIFPEDRIVEGDYELRRVGERNKQSSANLSDVGNGRVPDGDVISRTFSICEGRLDANGGVELCLPDGNETEYKGIYFEDYELDTTGKQADSTQKKEFRIGHIYDAVKANLLVFRQHVTTRQDEIAKGIVIGDNHLQPCGILEAWSCGDKPCRVEDYNVRAPTPEDMQRVALIRERASKGPAERHERPPEQRRAGQATQAIKPSVMEETAIHELCRAKPNEAFLSWKALEQEVAQCAAGEDDRQCKDRATLGAFRGWFEDQGHWRDLKPNAKDLDPTNRSAHAKHLKQIDSFRAGRQARVRVIDFDEVKTAHKCHHEGTEHERVDYHWTYSLGGEPQVIMTMQMGNGVPPHNDSIKRDYFKASAPCGYAILETGDRIEGTAFFPSGEHFPFIPRFETRFYPDEFAKAGDYELRKVVKNANTVKAVEKAFAPVVEQFKKATLLATPPDKRKWWQNVRAAYDRQPERLELDKWRAVAKLVVSGAIQENKKPVKERHSDYVTPLMLGRLIATLNAPGASRQQVEAHYAGYLRRRVTEKERNVSVT